MKKVKFNEADCDKSPFCPVARMCPTEAVTLVKEGLFRNRIAFDSSKCIGCGKCTKVCPHAAFSSI